MNKKIHIQFIITFLLVLSFLLPVFVEAEAEEEKLSAPEEKGAVVINNGTETNEVAVFVYWLMIKAIEEGGIFDTGYNIYKKEDDKEKEIIFIYELEPFDLGNLNLGAFLIDEDVKIGKTYTYFVEAYDIGGLVSNQVETTIKVEVPEYESEKECHDEITLESSVEERKVALNWEKCGVLTQYDIYRDGKHLGTTFENNYQDENVDYGKHQYKVVMNEIDTEQLVENYNQGIFSIPTAQAQENEIFGEAIVNIKSPYNKYYIIMGIILVLGFALFVFCRSKKKSMIGDRL